MNFHHMPELHWIVGYPIALILMLLVSVALYGLFKRRGWL
jgi:Mg2+ and Co2+ transporter CorA